MAVVLCTLDYSASEIPGNAPVSISHLAVGLLELQVCVTMSVLYGARDQARGLTHVKQALCQLHFASVLRVDFL